MNAWELGRKYGLTPKEFKELFELQKGICPICEVPMSLDPTSKRYPAVDHCHRKGHRRSLLCQQCNLGLGCFGDSVDRLINAVIYIKTWYDKLEPLPPRKQHHQRFRGLIGRRKRQALMKLTPTVL